ncbi:MAG TPA: D-alanyl-D-alanine carboxypeptidase family protein [Pyrinomonadaceae bacterium]|nr:D-alanyl-D-alanine carboxypeptidase family protein [Pyrinomonadaceae bacterium]
MKNRRVHVLLIVATLVVVGIAVSAASLTRRGEASLSQGSRSKTERMVKMTDRPRATETKGETNSSPAFSAAASQNVTLRNEATWTFGGKQQRGWHLYDLLIGKTVNTEHDPLSNDFAASLSKWQKKSGLGSTGVLDQNTLMAMISQWQRNRLKIRTPATQDQLILAPAADFYDPSRAPELRQVERKTYEAYKEMVAAAHADPALKLSSKDNYFKIISSFRSPEYQAELRRKSPNAGSAGLAVNSPHFTGRALDIYVGGSPVETKDSNRAIQVNTPAYRWLVRNAERFGFRPYFYEPWHWEYVK